MAFIKCVGGVKLESSEIVCDPAVIRTKSSVLETEPLTKSEPVIKVEQVEIGVHDILNPSDEDYIDNNHLRKNQKVLGHRTENIPDININETDLDGNKTPNSDKDEKPNYKDFSAVNNLAWNEQLVVNFGGNIQNTKSTSRKFIGGNKIELAEAYRTDETTNCKEDLKKVIVHRNIQKSKRSRWAVIKPEQVEIRVDDILNSSDEDYIDNNHLRKNQKVLSHRMENIPDININETRLDGNKAPNSDKDEKPNYKDFSAVNNLAPNEQLVVNFGKNFQNIENASRIFVSGDEINWKKAYRTCETTNCEEDLKKVIVQKNVQKSKRARWANIVTGNSYRVSIEPHEYTSYDSSKVVCNYCQRVYRNIRPLRAHIRRVHREERYIYQCPYCPFKSQSNLRLHIISKHKDEMDIQWFQCYKCNAKFKTKSQMARHIMSHLSKEELHDILPSCSICEKKFRDNTAIELHKKYVHDKMPPKKFQCTECEYTISNITLLKQHVKVYHTHPNQLPTHKCKHCDYQTKNEFYLERHSRLHRAPLTCDKCGYLASCTGTFKLHQMKHKKKFDESELKYRCTKCDYKTYRMYSLTVHKLNHLKPHQIQYFYCYHCDFKAKRKDNLKTHVLRHFKKGDVTFQCFICDFSTKKRDLLINHFDKHSKAQNQQQST